MSTATQTGVTSPRSRTERLVDRAFGLLAGLPRRRGDWAVTRGIGVPMRDGVELVTDHYSPAGEVDQGTVLVRTPYGRTGIGSVVMGRMFADRGYHVLMQSCRGTFGSGTGFRPMEREVEDGHDTVAWLREQPWFDGRLATAGASYLGFTQWALLMDPPPELRTAIVLVGPHDMHRSAWGTGSFSLDDFFGWSELITNQELPGVIKGLQRQLTVTKRLAPGKNGLPLLEAGEALLRGEAPWYRDWLGIPDGDDPFWKPLRLAAALDNVEIPVLLIGGWMDLFLDQTLAQYAHLSGRGQQVALTVGPWTHTGVLTAGARTVVPEEVAWLDEHLAGIRPAGRAAPVRVFVTGEGGGWRGLPDWPPATSDTVLHLQPEGRLGSDPAPADAPPATFTYDPADPTPSLGGRLLGPGVSGYRDSRPLTTRTDVLTFTGSPLVEPVEIAGSVVVELAHRSDNPSADVFVRLCDVAPDGRATNVSDVLVRLTPGQADADLVLTLDATAHRFGVGHCVRLLVAGGAHPRYARNLGSGAAQATGTSLTPSHRTIGLAGSLLRLPVVGR